MAAGVPDHTPSYYTLQLKGSYLLWKKEKASPPAPAPPLSLLPGISVFYLPAHYQIDSIVRGNKYIYLKTIGVYPQKGGANPT